MSNMQLMQTHAAVGCSTVQYDKGASKARDFYHKNEGKNFVCLEVEIPKGYYLKKEGEKLKGKTIRYLQQPHDSHAVMGAGLCWTGDIKFVYERWSQECDLMTQETIIIVKEKTKKDELLEKIEELKQQVKELDNE